MYHPEIGMISLDDLRLFVAVARAGNFVGAARATRTPTSTVSRGIARLEAQVGAPLFHRTSRRVNLTTEGARLLERSASLIDGLLDVAADARELTAEPAGRLRVTAPVVSGASFIGGALASFAKAFPRVEVEVRVTNAVVDLAQHGFDLGFRAGPIRQAGLVGRRIWTAEHALVASAAFVTESLQGRTTVTGAELSSLPSIVNARGVRWTFERGVVTPRERFCVDDPRIALDCARRGLGIARIPAHMLEVDAPLVVLGCDLGRLEARNLYAVRPAGRAPRRVRMAIEWVARHAPR